MSTFIRTSLKINWYYFCGQENLDISRIIRTGEFSGIIKLIEIIYVKDLLDFSLLSYWWDLNLFKIARNIEPSI